ncbi:rap domain protein, partial [Cystoisospora suis]
MVPSSSSLSTPSNSHSRILGMGGSYLKKTARHQTSASRLFSPCLFLGMHRHFSSPLFSSFFPVSSSSSSPPTSQNASFFFSSFSSPPSNPQMNSVLLFPRKGRRRRREPLSRFHPISSFSLSSSFSSSSSLHVNFRFPSDSPVSSPTTRLSFSSRFLSSLSSSLTSSFRPFSSSSHTSTSIFPFIFSRSYLSSRLYPTCLHSRSSSLSFFSLQNLPSPLSSQEKSSLVSSPFLQTHAHLLPSLSSSSSLSLSFSSIRRRSLGSTSLGLSSLGKKDEREKEEKKTRASSSKDRENEEKKKRKTVEKKQKKREIVGKEVNEERLHALQSIAWTALASIKQREHLDFFTSDSSFSSSSSVSSSFYPHQDGGPHTARNRKASGQSGREVAREEEEKKKIGDKEKRKEEEENELQRGGKREKENDWGIVKTSNRKKDDLEEEIRSSLLSRGDEAEEKYRDAVFSLLKEFQGEDSKNSEKPRGREQRMKFLVLLSTSSVAKETLEEREIEGEGEKEEEMRRDKERKKEEEEERQDVDRSITGSEVLCLLRCIWRLRGVFSPLSSPPSVELCYRRCFTHLREGGLLPLLSSSELAQLSLLLSKFSKAISLASPSSLATNKEEDDDDDEGREDQKTELTHRRYLDRSEDLLHTGDRALERGGEEEEGLERRDEEEKETLEAIIRQLFIANLNIFSDRLDEGKDEGGGLVGKVPPSLSDISLVIQSCSEAGLHVDVLRRIFTFLALISRSSSNPSSINGFSSSFFPERSTSSPGEPNQSLSRKRETSLSSSRLSSSRVSSSSPRRVQNLVSMNITQSQCIELLHTMATTGLYSAPAFDALLLRLFPPSGVCTPQGGRGGDTEDSEEMRQYEIIENPSHLVSSSSSSRSKANENGVTGVNQFHHPLRGKREEESRQPKRKDNSGLVGMRRRLLLDHQSESLRTLKLVELTMRLDLPHTYGQLSPDAMRILGLIRDTPYVDPHLLSDVVFSYQLSHFLRKHNFPCERVMEGPYALRLADSQRRLVIEMISSGDEEPSSSNSFNKVTPSRRRDVYTPQETLDRGEGALREKDEAKNQQGRDGGENEDFMDLLETQRERDEQVHLDATESLRRLKRATRARLRHLEDLGWRVIVVHYRDWS